MVILVVRGDAGIGKTEEKTPKIISAYGENLDRP
jgi:hypothetical protein